MTNEELLETLDSCGLLPSGLVAAVRRKVSAEGDRIQPAMIVRGLIAKGHLTQEEGERILSAPARPAKARWAPAADDDLEVLPDDDGDGEDDDDGDDMMPPPPPTGRANLPDELAETREAVPEDLDLVPLHHDSPPPKAAAAAKAPANPAKPATKKKSRMSWRGQVDRGSKESSAELLDEVGVAAPTGKSSKAGPVKKLREVKSGTGVKRAAGGSWDSPFLLIGGGTLLGLCILGVVLFFVLGRESGDKAFKQAEDDYNAGAHAQAIAEYDHYLEKFPKHAQMSLAKVHKGLALMRQSADNATDGSRALATAKSIVGEISSEKAFGEAQTELAALLPKIANNLAAQASAKPSETLITETREALAMVEKYVPTKLQDATKLRDIEASAALSAHRLELSTALASGIQEMKAAIAGGKPQDALAARGKLLQAYPELRDDKTLAETIAEAAQAQRAQVKFQAAAQPAATDEPPSPILGSVSLFSTTGAAAPPDENPHVVVLAAGASYCLDARTGKPLWRRYVGLDTTYVPQIIKTAAGPGVLALDTARQELLMLEPATGKLRWRQPLPDGTDAAPLVTRTKIIIAGRTGTILSFDRETGQLDGTIALPQPLHVAPALDQRERLYYQLGEHSNLYVLSAQTGECPEVFYLGHDAESVAVPPLVVGRYVFVAVNSGAEDSVLKVLLAGDDGLGLQLIEQLPLRGHLFAPLESSGRSLLIATDRGAIYSLEMGPPDSGKPLTKVAEKPADDKAPRVEYPVMHNSQMWLAGYGLTRYDMQAARGALNPKWIDNDQAIAVHAPTIQGAAIIYTSQREDAPGFTVISINGADSKHFWETRLAVPLAAEPMVEQEPDQAVALASSAALFEVPWANLKRKLAEPVAFEPGSKASVPVGAPMSRLAGGRFVLPLASPTSPAGLREVLVCEPRADAGRLRRRPLPDAASAWPAAMGNGLVVPGKLGQVLVLDPDTGHNVVEPFQPAVAAGSDINWGTPTVLSDTQLLIFDGATKLYRLEVTAAPRPHLAATASVDVASPLISPIAVRGEFAYAVDAGNKLCAFHLPDLAPGETWPLGSKPSWGPQLVGKQILVAGLNGQISCLDDQQRLAWQETLPAGELAGGPVDAGDSVLVASGSGTLFRLAADTGKPIAQVDVGQPLGFGPVSWKKNLLFAGRDGVLHIVAPPK